MQNRTSVDSLREEFQRFSLVENQVEDSATQEKKRSEVGSPKSTASFVKMQLKLAIKIPNGSGGFLSEARLKRNKDRQSEIKAKPEMKQTREDGTNTFDNNDVPVEVKQSEVELKQPLRSRKKKFSDDEEEIKFSKRQKREGEMQQEAELTLQQQLINTQLELKQWQQRALAAEAKLTQLTETVLDMKNVNERPWPTTPRPNDSQSGSRKRCKRQ